MKKKSAEKTHVKKKKHPSKKITNKIMIKKPAIPKSEVKIEELLIENFVALQKVMVNLSVKFDSLTNKISKLLELFEISAKALAEKDFGMEKETKETEKILNKMNALGEQNKIIARGLTLMNDKLLEEPRYPAMKKPMPPPMQKAVPPQAIPGQNVAAMPQGMEGYQKSISSTKPQEFKKLPK